MRQLLNRLGRSRKTDAPASDDKSYSQTVLVVTTDSLIREEAEYGFPSDVKVVLASDSREAIVAMKDITPDACVVDIQTGSAGGFSLVRDMSQSSRLANIPVLMLLERPQDEWLAQQAGAEEVRVKPIETSDLVELTLGLTVAAA